MRTRFVLFATFSYENVCRTTERYIFERSSRKKTVAETLHSNISTTLFLKYLFVIVICRTHTFSLTHSHLSLHAHYSHVLARACIHTDPGNPEMDIFVDYMVATALDQWNERDTLISLLIILWHSLWRVSSWYFPKVEASHPLYLRRPRSWRINIEQLSSPTG